ncbi:MAG: hypothetical protein SFU86_16125 [Pirellulaceae bacterium]|nr:hypothetical protein [Pirellulaceae bacterium]
MLLLMLGNDPFQRIENAFLHGLPQHGTTDLKLGLQLGGNRLEPIQFSAGGGKVGWIIYKRLPDSDPV